MKTRILLLIVMLVIFSPFLRAQSAFEAWVDSQIKTSVDKAQDAIASDPQLVGQNGKGVDRQKESPSADPRSTSLVDQSSATDFFSVAANVIPVTPGLSQFTSGSGGPASTNPSATGSTTATASLYAILAALNKTNPTKAEFYKQHIFSRRISFTIGTVASQQATDNTTTPATEYGSKLLLINKRELFTKANLAELARVQKVVSDGAVADAPLKEKIKEMIFASLHPNSLSPGGVPDPNEFFVFNTTELSDANFQTTLNNLSPDAKKQIQALIERSIDPFSKEQAAIQDAYDRISKGMQMSVSYTGDIRDSKGNNNHRGTLAFDYGLSDRINWTFNASADYTDRKMASDSKGGRAATEFQGDLTKSNSAWGRSPIRVSFSGQAQWLTAQKPEYSFQAKLTIPLTSGVDLPIVYRYANRAAQINKSDSEARLGLSIDVSRLAQAFK
jgi:hypothetical protein